MHKPKMFRTIIVVLIITLLLSSCSIVETEQGDIIKGYCENFIDAVLANDVDAAYSMLSDSYIAGEDNKENFTLFFNALSEYIAGVNTYELVQKGWQTGTDNGIGYYQATFEMKTNTETYYVVGLIVDGYNKLYNIQIVAEDQSNFVFTGTLTTLSDANLLQWGMILFSAVVLVFVVIMFVDCCKRKIKRKALWLIIIGIGALVFAVSHSGNYNNFNINLGAYIFRYSYLQIYATGDYVFNLVIPVGAIIYFFVRKKINLKDNLTEEQNLNIDSDNEDAENITSSTDALLSNNKEKSEEVQDEKQTK